jgi:hypothetical protein
MGYLILDKNKVVIPKLFTSRNNPPSYLKG